MSSFVPFVFIYLFLSSSLDISMAARHIPSSAPSTIVSPLVSEAEDYMTMKPQLDHKRQVFSGKEVRNCLPKGFKISSAPSRYANYNTFGSSSCSSPNKHSGKP